jgi:hypothetical protein
VYAETVISAATFTSCHECVSECDKRFRALLCGEAFPQQKSLRTSAEVKEWQKRLIENADSYSSLAARAKGPVLTRRLQPVFNAVDAYLRRVGDLFAVFDREFAFLQDTSPTELSQMRRMLWVHSEDSKLASFLLIRFGSEIEGCEAPFRDQVPHRNADLNARLILLQDFIRKKRLEYEIVGGLYR